MHKPMSAGPLVFASPDRQDLACGALCRCSPTRLRPNLIRNRSVCRSSILGDSLHDGQMHIMALWSACSSAHMVCHILAPAALAQSRDAHQESLGAGRIRVDRNVI